MVGTQSFGGFRDAEYGGQYIICDCPENISPSQTRPHEGNIWGEGMSLIWYMKMNWLKPIRLLENEMAPIAFTPEPLLRWFNACFSVRRVCNKKKNLCLWLFLTQCSCASETKKASAGIQTSFLHSITRFHVGDDSGLKIQETRALFAVEEK